MAKTYYSEYINHCLRLYTRHHISTITDEVSKLNWIACDKVFKPLNDNDKKLVKEVFSKNDTLMDNVYEVAKQNNIDQNRIWKILSDLQRKIAKERGLLK